MAINHDAFATGFEERMSRALNPVRIVVMEVIVYDMYSRGCHMQELSETL